MIKVKNMKFKISLFILLLTVISIRVNAQSLEELLGVAEANNFELKALENEYMAALEKAPQVSQLPDPEVNLGLFVLPAETRLGPQRVVLGASQMFPWKGTLQAKEHVVLSKARAKFERIEATKLNLFYQVKKAYFQLFNLEKSKDLIQDNIQIFSDLESLTLAKTESGKGSLADVLRVQLKVQELEQQIKIIDNQKRGALASLNQVLGRPATFPVTITDDFETAKMPFNKDSLANVIHENHPLIRMYSLQQESAHKEIELNELNGKPAFGVGLDYIMVGNRSDASPENNGRDILIPKFKVTLPLYRKKYTAKNQEEHLKIAALENRKEHVLLKFLANIEKAYADYEDALLKLELYEKQIKTTKAAIDILQGSYSNSGSNFDELLRLENDLVKYDLKILQAIMNSHFAKIEIEKFIPLKK
jgi:outer membrane protein TolC